MIEPPLPELPPPPLERELDEELDELDDEPPELPELVEVEPELVLPLDVPPLDDEPPELLGAPPGKTPPSFESIFV